MLVGAFNQEKALVGAFSVIVYFHRLIVYSTTFSAWVLETPRLGSLETLVNIFRREQRVLVEGGHTQHAGLLAAVHPLDVAQLLLAQGVGGVPQGVQVVFVVRAAGEGVGAGLGVLLEVVGDQHLSPATVRLVVHVEVVSVLH